MNLPVYRSCCHCLPLSQVLITAQDGWMTVHAQWTISEDGMTLLSRPNLDCVRKDIQTGRYVTVWCKIYYSYNTANQQTTIFTAGHNAMHLQLLLSLRQCSRHRPPSVLFIQLLPIWFSTVVDCIRTTVDSWQDHVGEVWVYCLSLIIQQLKTLQSLTAQTLKENTDLLRRITGLETNARIAGGIGHNFSALRRTSRICQANARN